MVVSPPQVCKGGGQTMQTATKPQSLLTGLEEASLIHNPNDFGYFSLLLVKLQYQPQVDRGERSANSAPKEQYSYLLCKMPIVFMELDLNRDTWYSQADFTGLNRRLVNLLRLNLCFVDLDTYKTDWRSDSPEHICECVYGYCRYEGIPEPSLILYSGRGLQVKWLLERPIPRAALPRWNAIQSHLVTALERYGADQGARDASRVLRIVDTINTRSGERVRVLWVNEENGVIKRYNFEYLAETILPLARNALKEQREAKQARPRLTIIPGTKTGNLRSFSPRQLAWDRQEDLRTLAALRMWTVNGIPHGFRSKYIHWVLNFLLLSGAAHSSNMFYEAQALVREVCPDFAKDKEVRSVLSTLYTKAKAYEAGEKIEFNGKKYPPLYTPRNDTLIELFDIQPHEFPFLKTIIPTDVAKARHAEREQERREKAGAMDRATYVETRKETAEQRRAQARLLKAKGLTWAEVGKEMGISANAAKLLGNR